MTVHPLPIILLALRPATAAGFVMVFTNRTMLRNQKPQPNPLRLTVAVLRYYRSYIIQHRVRHSPPHPSHRTRNGSEFSDTTVLRLLRDPSAKGMRRANYTKSLGDNKKWVIKDEKDWVYKPCPAIVSVDLWDECNQILDELEGKRRKPGRQPLRLLTGYVTCSCGRRMYVFHQAPVYHCKVCKNRIMEDDIDEIYHDQLKSFLFTDSDLATFQSQSDSILAEKQALITVIQSDLNQLQKQASEYVTMRVNKELTPIRFQEYYKPLEERITQLEKQLPILQAEIDFLRIQQLSSDTVLQEARNLYEQWPQLPFEEKRNIVETITESIVIDKHDISISFSYLPAPLLQNGGNKQRNFIPALPFSNTVKKAVKPFGNKYIDQPMTIGQHLCNRRLKLRMLQREVAQELGVTEECISLWEPGEHRPQINMMPRIVQFLAYSPMEEDASTFGETIKIYRYRNGLSQKKWAV